MFVYNIFPSISDFDAELDYDIFASISDFDAEVVEVVEVEHVEQVLPLEVKEMAEMVEDLLPLEQFRRAQSRRNQYQSHNHFGRHPK